MTSTIPAASADRDCVRVVIDFALWRDVLLVKRADAGDVDAMIEWLRRYGGPEWRD